MIAYFEPDKTYPGQKPPSPNHKVQVVTLSTSGNKDKSTPFSVYSKLHMTTKEEIK